jgi:4-alpha-glucanotransferase
VTTHDLPTIAGLWTGADLDAQLDLGLQPNVKGWKEIRSRLGGVAGVADDAPVEDVITGVHHELASAPSLLVSCTLDDALAVTERPNMPGTLTEWPNWSIALPVPIDELNTLPLANRVAASLQRPSA